MQAAEIELKFAVEDVRVLQQKATALGFILRTERTFEGNTLYDTPGRTLQAKRQVIRLRTYGAKCVLTHKRQPDDEPAGAPYKTRIETETLIDDCAAMAEIFAHLGLQEVFRYEKYRTEWDAPSGEGHLVLDETPIGIWAELEGPPAWIDATLAQLNVPASQTSTLSYGKLFLAWKKRTGSDAANMVFPAA